MATIYKRKQDSLKRRQYWYIGFTDSQGKRCTKRGFTDRAATERLAFQIEEEMRMVKEGLKAPALDLKQFTIVQAVTEFSRHLANRDVSEKQVWAVSSKIQRVMASCGYHRVIEIRGTGVENCLGVYRAEGMSKQTSNHYLTAIGQFCRWLVKTRRLTENPVADLKKLNVQTDRRHDRRALSMEEFSRLLEATKSGRTVEGIVGTDRAMMYVLAAWTGYRKGEIGSLRRSSFDLEGNPPTVTVAANYSKRKRRDVQVLHLMVVEQFREWLLEKQPTAEAILFPVSAKSSGYERKTAKMMRVDLAKARATWLAEANSAEERQQRENSDFLSYRNESGLYADFHANRHTFITNLGRFGVSPKTAQTLARHSDIRLTMNVYSHTDLAEKQAAVERLPNPRECFGSARGTPNGTECPPTSDEEEPERKRAEPISSAEVVAASRVDANCRQLSQAGKSTPKRARTSNLRFRRPMLYPIELWVQGDFGVVRAMLGVSRASNTQPRILNLTYESQSAKTTV